MKKEKKKKKSLEKETNEHRELCRQCADFRSWECTYLKVADYPRRLKKMQSPRILQVDDSRYC